MKRSEFEKTAASNGYEVTGNVKKATYLVTNTPDSGSSKNKTAKENGVPVITEAEFMKLIGKVI